MPNGGSDHCGNCRHNRVNVGRESTLEERGMPAFCTIRNVEIRATHSTYCANHYKSLRVALGPIYAEHGDGDRIPYHGEARPRHADVARCVVCGTASPGSGERRGVTIDDPARGTLGFCGAAHYARWWKQAHPGETLLWDCDAPAPSLAQARSREAGAMIELARAYVEIGDRQGAREVLEEVAKTATGPERDEAATLLASLER